MNDVDLEFKSSCSFPWEFDKVFSGWVAGIKVSCLFIEAPVQGWGLSNNKYFPKIKSRNYLNYFFFWNLPIYAMVPADFDMEIVEGVNEYDDEEKFNNVEDIDDFEHNEEDVKREDVDFWAARGKKEDSDCWFIRG